MRFQAAINHATRLPLYCCWAYGGIFCTNAIIRRMQQNLKALKNHFSHKPFNFFQHGVFIIQIFFYDFD